MTEDRAPLVGGTGPGERTGVFVALGTNLPFEGRSGPALLGLALDRIAAANVKVVKRSSFFESPPWPPSLGDQPAFVNAVAEVDPGDLDASELYRVLAAIEAEFGRERRRKWAARTLDLDIVDFRGMVSEAGGLSLPHPRAGERAFVLAPLAEIAPSWRHPVYGASALELLGALGQNQGLRRLA